MISRTNNFDFLRLIFASFVIITHSYPLSGSTDSELLAKLTLGQVSFSYLGVKGFFIISGFLIYKSLQRCESLQDYYWKRILRLFPALFVVLLLTVLLAPIVYESTVPYWKNGSVYSYLPRNLKLYFLQYKIDGVFEKNPYPGAINGSLWTIAFEFSMYIMVSALFFIRKKEVVKIVVPLLFVFSYISAVFFPDFLNDSVFSKIGLDTHSLYDLMCYFTGGMLLTYLNTSKKVENILIISSFVILMASLYFNIFSYTAFFTLPILVILIGKKSTMYINKVGDYLGDTSYGIYIYAFPIQQTLMYFFKLEPVPLTIYTLLLVFPMGYLSWHLIEKKALRYKDLISKKAIRQ